MTARFRLGGANAIVLAALFGTLVYVLFDGRLAQRLRSVDPPAARGDAASAVPWQSRSLPAEETRRLEPELSAGMVLTGVVVQGAASLAVISRDGREEVYAIGQEVRPGVLVAEVMQSAVVLADRQRQQHLALTGGVPSQRVSSEPLRPAPSDTATPESQPARSISIARRAMPERAGDGILLKQVRADSAYASIGLLSGDRVRTVNGEVPRSLRHLSVMAENLKSGAQGHIELTRDGKDMELRFGGG